MGEESSGGPADAAWDEVDPAETQVGGPTQDDPQASGADDAAPVAEDGPEASAPEEVDDGPSPPDVDRVDLSALAELASEVHGLADQVEAFHARAENYERIIREMQTRLEKLQGDQVQALLKPVIQRMAGLHAQAHEAAERARERGELAEKDFSFFTVTIEEALGLLDIGSVEAGVSGPFDPKVHHAARIVATDDPDLDGRIHRVVRQGFTYSGAPRVFLPAQVSVYRYEPPAEPSDGADPTDGSNDPTDEPTPGDPGD